MPHNPIIKREKLGLNQPEIGRTQEGVLLKGPLYHRLIPPKTQLSFPDRARFRDYTLYVIDCRSHTWRWEVRLPSRDEEHPFNCRITMTYAINNPLPIAKNDVYDLEKILEQALKPLLFSQTGQYRLDVYTDVISKIRALIAEHSVFHQYGLTLDPEIGVTVQLSEADRAFIDEMKQLIAARTKPRTAVLKGKLPTKQASYQFDVEVTLRYLIDDERTITSLAELERAVDRLWQATLLKTLRRESRKHSYTEIDEVDEALERLFDERDFAAYGIRVESADAVIEIDETSRQAATEEEQMERGFAKEIKKQSHVRSTVMTNRLDMLAAMYVKGEKSLNEVLAHLDEKELEAAGVPLETIKELQALNILDRDTAEDAARAILTSTLAAAATKQHPNEANELLLAMLQRTKLPPNASPTGQTEPDEGDGDSIVNG